MLTRLRNLSLAVLVLFGLQTVWAGEAGPAEASTGSVTTTAGIATAYGAPEVFRVSLDYTSPSHLNQITHYRRPVYVHGLFDHWEVLGSLTQEQDACVESLGPLTAEEARVVEEGGNSWLEIRYSQDVWHTNPQFGSFQVGSRTVVERQPIDAGGETGPPSSPAAAPSAGALDVALRTLESVRDFADYSAVFESDYAQDIEDAFRLGLIQGKYDYQDRFYDPEGLITTGEMLNILARNLGASPTTDGMASATYLASLGIATPGELQSQLTLGQLESLACQLARLDDAGKCDLLVIREAVAGTLDQDRDGGITRAHAVAMFRPAVAATVPPSEAHLPGPVPSHPADPGDGPGSSDTMPDFEPGPGTGPNPTNPSQGGQGPAPLRLPLFVLTD